MIGSHSEADLDADSDHGDHSSAKSGSEDSNLYISYSLSAEEDEPPPDINDILESGRVWENLTEEEGGISGFFERGQLPSLTVTGIQTSVSH